MPQLLSRHVPVAPHRLGAALGLAWLLLAPAQAGEFSDEFDRQRFKTAFQHEIAFREAALHVAWSAEPLCDDTTEIEPFVLWSLRGVRKGLLADAQKLFTQATGMDAHWRIAWLDEGAPDSLRLGQRSSDSVGNAFLVGKVLALAVPGMGTVLSALESQTRRQLQVDGLVGGADLFANEVVLAMGGDPAVGLKLSDRLARDKVAADILSMTAFRRSNVEIQLQQLQAMEAARRQADLAADEDVGGHGNGNGNGSGSGATKPAGKPATQTP